MYSLLSRRLVATLTGRYIRMFQDGPIPTASLSTDGPSAKQRSAGPVALLDIHPIVRKMGIPVSRSRSVHPLIIISVAVWACSAPLPGVRSNADQRLANRLTVAVLLC